MTWESDPFTGFDSFFNIPAMYEGEFPHAKP